MSKEKELLEKLNNVNTTRWYEDDDINEYIEVKIQHELGGFDNRASYMLKNKFPCNITQAETIVAFTPSIDNRNIDNSLPINYFLDKTNFPVSTGRKDNLNDVFDEIMPELDKGECNNAKILFGYNQNGGHWCIGEVNIHKNSNNYEISVYKHDTFGGGITSDSNFNLLKDTLQKRIKAFHPLATVNVNNVESPYKSMQSDGCSCGVISAENIIQRIKGRNLDIRYPAGAEDLRKSHMKTMFYHGKNKVATEKFINRNTKNHYYKLSSSNGLNNSSNIPSSSSNAPSSSTGSYPKSNYSYNIDIPEDKISEESYYKTLALEFIKIFTTLISLPVITLINIYKEVSNLMSNILRIFDRKEEIIHNSAEKSVNISNYFVVDNKHVNKYLRSSNIQKDHRERI